MAEDCVFCKISRREIPAEFLFEDDQLYVIRDIHPKAPTHLLMVPKEHIATINDVIEDHGVLLSNMILAAKNQAQATGIAESGYKLVFNVGKHGGQTVFHIHLHVLGGKQLAE